MLCQMNKHTLYPNNTYFVSNTFSRNTAVKPDTEQAGCSGFVKPVIFLTLQTS